MANGRGPEAAGTFKQLDSGTALALLARLFRYGEISDHGGFVNLATGATSVLRIDPQYWQRTRKFSKRSSQIHQN